MAWGSFVLRTVAYPPYDPGMNLVTTADGTRLATHLLGESSIDPALVLPGGPCRDVEYLGDLAGLAQDRPLVVIHPRGTTTTGGLSRGWWNDASDVIAVADSVGLSTFDLVAHSAGTRQALAVAAMFPGRVRSMLLVTPATALLAGSDHDGAEIAALRTEPELAVALASLTGPPPSDEASFQRARALQGPAGYARWGTAERAHAAVGAQTFAAASAWFDDVPDDAASRILAAALPRALVLGGTDDILSGVRAVRTYAESVGAGLTLIDDCGHYPWIEQPRTFRRVAANWLAA